MRILKIDKNWTLFLDRDGVINKRLKNDFVTGWEEFEFLNLALAAISMLSNYFSKIIVVTNQRCVDEGLLLKTDLDSIHDRLSKEVIKHGGQLTTIYSCPHTKESNCNCRKPKTGMGLKAKEDFPEINFNKSIIVGDSFTDLQFGKRLNMKTVFITKFAKEHQPDEVTDYVFDSLFSFATFIDSQQ